MGTELRVLDLFSGIGGFSLALRSVARTVAYCDVDPACRAVLTRHMARGALDASPVFEDVTKLRGADVKPLRPNMITAGFPCTDISGANPRGKGLQGARSGLFSEVLRLIDECRGIRVVFLENSPVIVHKGFDTVRAELEARGFEVRFCIAQAAHVGALHRRRRWYCLAWRPVTFTRVLERSRIDEKHLRFDWQAVQGLPRIMRVDDINNRKRAHARCGMLGNSIVPQCAMHAWNTLIGSVRQSGSVQVALRPFLRSPPCDIVMSDGERVVRKDYWATPIQSLWYPPRSLYDRSLTVLCTQLYYDTKTRIAEPDKGRAILNYCVAPAFVECLMGYPQGWTRF